MHDAYMIQALHTFINVWIIFKSGGTRIAQSVLVRNLGARGPEFDSQISHLCFDFFPFIVAYVVTYVIVT